MGYGYELGKEWSKFPAYPSAPFDLAEQEPLVIPTPKAWSSDSLTLATGGHWWLVSIGCDIRASSRSVGADDISRRANRTARVYLESESFVWL